MIGIEVKITDRCNQKCFFCANNDGPSNRSDIDQKLFLERFQDLVRDGKDSGWSVKEVRMTGGEPLLFMPGLLEIAGCCSALGIASGINTNGTLLNEDVALQLKDAGLQTIKISLDSLDPVLFQRIRGVQASLSRVLDGIKIAVGGGFNVVIRFTLTSLNRDEMISCFQWAGEVGASRFQVKPLIESGRGKHHKARLDSDDLFSSIEGLSKAEGKLSCVPEILCLPPGKAFGMAGKCCGSVNKIYISVDGEVCSCNFIPGPAIGSIRSESLSAILEKRSRIVKFNRINGDLALAGCPQYPDDFIR